MENFTTIMEQYLVMHGVETMKTLNAIKDDCEANGKSMDFKFKIDFLKRVHYKTVDSYKSFEMYHNLSSSGSSGNDMHDETIDIADDISMAETGNDFGMSHFIPSSTPMTFRQITLNGNGKKAADHDLFGATFKKPRPTAESNYLSKDINKNSEMWNNSSVTSNSNTNSVISNNNFIPNGNLASIMEHVQPAKTVPLLSYPFHIPPPNYARPPKYVPLSNYVSLPNYAPPSIQVPLPERFPISNGISNSTFKTQQDNKKPEMNETELFRNLETFADQKSSNKWVKLPEVGVNHEHRELMCYLCKEQRTCDIKSFVFTSIEDFDTHWQSEHSSDTFPRFYVVDLLACNVSNCNYRSSFSGLLNHHKKHLGEIFVAIQNGRCALCLYPGPNLNTHACNALEDIKKMYLHHPILFTDDTLDEMRCINIIPRKYQCKLCDHISENGPELRRHYDQHHRNKSLQYHVLIEPAPIDGVICGCCNRWMDPIQHENHLKSKAQERWPKYAATKQAYQNFKRNYLKTKIIFNNGLVAYKQNLIATDIGEFKKFEDLCKDQVLKVMEVDDSE